MFYVNKKYVLYCSIKSRIKISEGTSAYFPCCTGVRQGENLSPFLFSNMKYSNMNDLEDYFCRNKASGISCETDDDNVTVCLKNLYYYTQMILCCLVKPKTTCSNL